MKIKKIRLTNFRWHRDLEINNIPKYLIITGPNASGKSSVLHGLTWGLTGVTKHTSASGAGADTLIMDGEGRAIVEIEIETASGTHTIKRSIPHALEVDGTRGGVKRTMELLRTILSPLSPEVLLHTFEGSRILSMNDSDRKGLLASVIGVGVQTDEQILVNLRTWLQAQGIVPDGTEGTTVLQYYADQADKTHKGFYTSRTENNAILNALKGIPETVPTTEQEGPTLEYLYSRQAMLDLELKLAEKMNPDGKEEKGATVIKPNTEKIKSKVVNLRSMVSTMEKSAAAKKERIVLAESQMNQVTSAAKQCPVFCKECPLPDDEIKEAIAVIESTQTTVKRELSSDNRRITMTKKALDIAEKELEEAEKEIEEWSKVWAAGDTHTFEKLRSPEEIKKDLENIKVQITNTHSKTNQQAATTELQEQILKLQNARTNAKPLETLVKAFAPAGITTMLLTQHLPRLEELATQASHQITGGRYEITFSVQEGELDVSVVSDNKRRDISSLSTSEEIWVSFIIQHVINSYTGNRILVIDEAATLDTQMQEGLQRFLHPGGLAAGVEADYDTIIICATTNNGDNFLPDLPEDQVLRHHLGGVHVPVRTN